METGSKNIHQNKDLTGFTCTAIAIIARQTQRIRRKYRETEFNPWKCILLFFLTMSINVCSASSEKMAGDLSATKESSSSQLVQAGIAQFSHAFYKALRQEHAENLVSSPYSLSLVLAMLKVASRGVSALEIQNSMRFPADDDVLLKGFSYLLSTQRKENSDGDDNDEAFVTVNKIYAQQGIPLNRDYCSKLETYFSSTMEQLNFSNSQNSAEIINGWTSEKTKNKISQLFGPNAFTALTRIVLVSAVYLKGQWVHKFDKENTEKKPFFINDEESVPVDMMMQNRNFLYAEVEDFKIVSLPFKSNNLSMVILLPNKITGLRDLEAKLTNADILKYCGQLGFSPVEISLPKFTLESTLNLKNTLIKLGMPSLFDASIADLGGIFDDVQELEVSEVIQKAVIEVNEEGAEAAAATGVKIRTRRAVALPEEFNANHPFIFAIVQNQEQDVANDKATIIFYGSFVNPTAHSRSARNLNPKEEL